MEQNTKKTKLTSVKNPKNNENTNENGNIINKLDGIQKLLELIYHELNKNKSPFEQ